MTREQLNEQVYLGYFATLMLALLLSASAASSLAPWLSMRFAEFDHHGVEGQVTSAIFFAICFANPIGVWIRASSAKSMMLRAAVGLILGGQLHCYVLEPIVGDPLLRFSLLLIGSLGVPVLMALDFIRAWRNTSESSAASERAVRIAVRLFRWHERALFIVVMIGAFAAFVAYSDTPLQSLVALIILLSLMTGLVAFRSARESEERRANTEDFQAWLDLLPESEPDEPNLRDELGWRAARFAFTIFPGAAFVGGVMGFAVSLAPVLQPVQGERLSIRSDALEASYLMAATGIGLVIAGLLVSVLISAIILRIIAHYAQWERDQTRSAFFRLMRTLSFRPINRA